MTINQHADTFAGKPIKDYDPAIGLVGESMSRREFQFVEGTSQKFWTIALDGPRHTVTYGRLGTARQTLTKEFANEAQARKSYEKLVAEKVKKGYTEVAASPPPAASGASTGPDAASSATELPVAYRLRLDYDEMDAGESLTDRLAAFLDDPAAGRVTALVLGTWSFEGGDSAPLVEALVAARDKLPSLRGLFLGDIIMEEQEISWIQQTDVGPLFAAYPQLEHFRVRGGTGLRLGRLSHKKLKSLVIESGGLSAEVVREVGAAKLPELEHLELWLGTPEYGGDATVEDLKPILAGKAFPRLRYLGLRDSMIADAVAAAVASAPILGRLRILDLSLGILGDEGAQALLASPAVAKLEKLDVHHHYLSAALMKKLKALGIDVDVREQQKPDASDPEYRYIAHAE